MERLRDTPATIAGGTASQTVTANGVVGTYLVTATAQGAAPNITYALTNTDVSIVGLTAGNDSPTVVGSATHLTATISAGSNVTFIWDFGDGSMGAGQNPSHTYGALGPYTAVVTATTIDAAATAVGVNAMVPTALGVISGTAHSGPMMRTPACSA